MLAEVRKRYNAAFTDQAYQAFLHDVNTTLKYPADFRIPETPLFLSRVLADELLRASQQIIDLLQSDGYQQQTRNAIPSSYAVPGEDQHTTFLQLDFAICRDAQGNFTPRLIELQGFPSLYGFQAFLDLKMRRYFEIPAGWAFYFDDLDYERYVALLKQVIVADSDLERVILMEIEPERQKTRIDFACTEQMLGIRSVCLTTISKKGDKLFYTHEGRQIPIERIYNRVIRDDPKFQALQKQHSIAWLDEPLDVTWVGHPNWYYKISKYSLPLLDNPYVPSCYFLDQLTDYPSDLENYVLKPLFLFSGAGVELDVSAARLDGLTDKHNYILQRKVDYAPLIETPDSGADRYARAEIRMLYVWHEGRLQPTCNLVRLSKGKMMGVRFNKDKTWVGSTLAYYPR